MSNMTREEFEQAVLAEPFTDCPDCAAYAREHSDGMQFLERVQRLDAQLRDVMQVAVPASLSAPIPDMAALQAATDATATDNVVSMASKRRKSRVVAPAWALAACVALVAVFVVRQQDAGLAPGGVDTEALTAEVIEHLGPEISSMRLVSTEVSASKLESVLAPAGATMDQAPGVVSYAKSCLINGKLVPHLVVQGEAGPVTVLLMPGEAIDGPVSIMRDGFEGVILPVGDGGSIAIIGRDKASVEAVQRDTQSAVSFSI